MFKHLPLLLALIAIPSTASAVFWDECGNYDCAPSENCSSCPEDCGSCGGGWCGDGWCDEWGAGENCSWCATDCGSCSYCGDYYCDASESCNSCPSDCGGCVCNGTPGQWAGCRGNGCAVCAERLGQNYPCYFQLHPQCQLNTTCDNQFYTCNANCPAPSTAEACGACNGTPGQWAGCRGNGCAVCVELVAQYPCYFQNHPTCQPNTTCNGVAFTCNAACPQPTQADTCQSCNPADGYPVHPTSGSPVCPPYNQPIVFFAAHPDDETIGAAGGIRDAVVSGRTVIVELMTHGEASGARGTLQNEPSHGGPEGHAGPYNNVLSVTNFGNARVREFQDSMGRLGVAGVRVLDLGDGQLSGKVAQIQVRVQWWIDRNDPQLALRATAGDDDIGDVGWTTTHPDHKAVHDALANVSFGDKRWWFVYEYRSGAQTFNEQVSLSGPTCTAKRNALDAYRVWNVAYQSDPNGRYAIGWYHSTGDLFSGAYNDCSEYWINH